MSFDAYEVAIHLKLVDQFSGAAELFAKKLAKSSKHAGELQRKLEKIKDSFPATASAAAKGADVLGDAADQAAGKWQKLADKIKGTYKTAAAVSGIGYGMAMMLKSPLNRAMTYEQEQIRLKALNVDGRFGKGTSAALEQRAATIAKNTMGTTDADALRMATESQVVTGSRKKAEALAPTLAKLRFGIEGYAGAGKGDEAENKFVELLQKMKDKGMTAHFSAEKCRCRSRPCRNRRRKLRRLRRQPRAADRAAGMGEKRAGHHPAVGILRPPCTWPARASGHLSSRKGHMSDQETRLAVAEMKLAHHDRLHEETQESIKILSEGIAKLVQAEIRREQDQKAFERCSA